MGKVGFEEGFADGMEAETLVEGDGMRLGMETENGRIGDLRFVICD